MPDKKANKNYNISITDKEEIAKESISKITKQFSEKIELVGKQIFENVNKQYQEIMALKLEITQLKESQDFLSNKYDELKTEFEQLNVINSKQEKELYNLKKNSIELKNNANHEREKFDNLEQYGRRQNLEFVGIPYEKNENLNQIVSDLAEKIGVPIKEQRARESGYHYIWTNNGKIYNRKSQEYDSININMNLILINCK